MWGWREYGGGQLVCGCVRCSRRQAVFSEALLECFNYIILSHMHMYYKLKKKKCTKSDPQVVILNIYTYG